jgi:hypothetical protein
VAVSADTISDVGQTAFLTCVAFGEPDVEISWSRNGSSIANSDLAAISEQGLVKGGRMFKQSFLQLCSLDISDAGDYSCIARNRLTSIAAVTELSG